MPLAAPEVETEQVELGAPSAARLAEGVELFGEYEAGGFVEPTYLAGRRDGQVIQLSRLLYLVARHLDGESNSGHVAERVSSELGRTVSAGNVDFLLERHLAPLGLLAPPPGSEAPAPIATPLFALGLRAAVLPAQVVKVLTRPFLFLFRPPVVVAVLLALIVVDVWLFAVHGVTTELIRVLTDPALLVALGVLQWTSGAFHEIGHAAACRFGGAKPGRIGAGIFLVWPVLYSDVTDSYRLNRAGRLRTDLAGVYFDAIATLVIAGIYATTGNELFLVAIVFQHIDMAYQFLPFLRLDGYYMVSDLVGVPDLYGRIGPILRSLRPGREPGPAVTELRPRVRAVVTVWVVTSVIVIGAGIGVFLFRLPAWFAEATKALARYAEASRSSWAEGSFFDAALNGWRAVMLFLPVLGTLYIIYRLVARRRRTARRSLGPAVTLDNLGDYPFRRQWRGFDRKEVRAFLGAIAQKASERASERAAAAPAAPDEELLDQARDEARQIREAAEQEAAIALEQARRTAEEVAEEVAQVMVEEARQLYEEAVEETARMRAAAERRSAEILEAARRQLDLAVELKLELRRELDQESQGSGLRVVADAPDDPSIAS